jgi:hypothetical protein
VLRCWGPTSSVAGSAVLISSSLLCLGAPTPTTSSFHFTTFWWAPRRTIHVLSPLLPLITGHRSLDTGIRPAIEPSGRPRALRRDAEAGFSSEWGTIRSASWVPSSKSVVPASSFTSSPQQALAGSSFRVSTLGFLGSCLVSGLGGAGMTGLGGWISGIGGVLPGEAPLPHMMSVRRTTFSPSNFTSIENSCG